MRRLSPFVPTLILAYDSVAAIKADPMQAAVYFAPRVSEIFAQMKDEDVQYIINACMEVTQIEQPPMGWSNLMANGRLMHSQIDLFTSLNICYAVIQDTFTSFFLDLKTVAPTAPTPAV